MADVLNYSSDDPADRARSSLGELLSLAGPTVAQMASYTLMQFFDTWMLAHVGTGVNEPTAASNGGMISFSVISIGMGTLFVVNTLVSQAFGGKDYAACGRYLWQGIWFALGFSVLLLAGLPFLSRVFTGFGHEPELVRLESLYLRIVLCGSALKLVGTACSQFLVAVNRPGSVLIATLTGVSANVLAAWSMIFGHLGFPRLGVVGSAWGQNIGVFVEMSAAICFVTLPHIRRVYNIRDFKPRPAMLFTLLKIGLPSGVQIVADVLAWSMYTMWVMGVFGTKIMAANTFIFRFMSVSFMPAFGIGTAVTALVGRYLGRGRPDIARRRADLGFVVSAVYMLTCGLLFFAGPQHADGPVHERSRNPPRRWNAPDIRGHLPVLRRHVHQLQRRIARGRRHILSRTGHRLPLLGNDRLRRLRRRALAHQLGPGRAVECRDVLRGYSGRIHAHPLSAREVESDSERARAGRFSHC